jgi:hypothetical protein
MSTLVTGTIKSNTANPPLFQNTSGTEIGTLCRAWVNFNGTGTVAIRASYNVSSITDNGVGDYTVNFATALVDANYSVLTTCRDDGTVNFVNSLSNIVNTKTTTALRVISASRSTGSLVDSPEYNVAIFR